MKLLRTCVSNFFNIASLDPLNDLYYVARLHYL